MTDSGPVRPVPGGVRVDVKVIPRSSRNAIEGVRGGRVVIRVNAAPADNAANEAAIRLLADALGVPKRDIRLCTGATTRMKSFEVVGVAPDVTVRLGGRADGH